MRFTPYITILAALAGIASAVPALDLRNPSNGVSINSNNRDGTALVAKRATSDISPIETRKTSVTLPKAAKVRQRTDTLAAFSSGDAMLHGEVWHLGDGSYVTEDKVKAGETIKLYNLSGCSAIFVMGADELKAAFHITAGEETTLAKAVATYIQSKGKSEKLVPETIVVYTREGGTINYNDITKALGTDLAKLVTHKKYNYDPTTAPNTDRWQIDLTVGTTPASFMVRRYTLSDKTETGI